MRVLGAAFACLATLWAVLIVVTPGWWDRGGMATTRTTLAALVQLAGARVCHQRPDRSFHLHGRPMPVCGRCTGLYLSGAAGLVAATFAGRRRGAKRGAVAPREAGVAPVSRSAWLGRFDPRAGWLALAAVPTAATWLLEFAGAWDPGTPVRALAALPLGAAAGWFIGRSLRAARPGSRVEAHDPGLQDL